MVTRGWTKELINKTVNSSTITREALNKATGSSATAYFLKDGAYVVRDNITKEVIQISKIGDAGWIPDASIIDPYIPK